MTSPSENPELDRRAGYVNAFFDGVRFSCAHHEQYGWIRGDALRTLASCERVEELGLSAAFLLMELCCAGREPLRFKEAVAVVEAIYRAPTP